MREPNIKLTLAVAQSSKSIGELATIAGLSRSTIRTLCSGQVTPRKQTIRKLCGALGKAACELGFHPCSCAKCRSAEAVDYSEHLVARYTNPELVKAIEHCNCALTELDACTPDACETCTEYKRELKHTRALFIFVLIILWLNAVLNVINYR